MFNDALSLALSYHLVRSVSLAVTRVLRVLTSFALCNLAQGVS